MSTTPSESALRPAGAALTDRLLNIASVIHDLPIVGEHNRLTVDVELGKYERNTVGVHDCTPEQMQAAVYRYGVGGASLNSYGDPKWIETHVGSVEVTFYRRA